MRCFTVPAGCPQHNTRGRATKQGCAAGRNGEGGGATPLEVLDPDYHVRAQGAKFLRQAAIDLVGQALEIDQT